MPMNGEKEPVVPRTRRDEITQLLVDWGQGDHGALEKLTPVVYKQLRRLAHAHENADLIVETDSLPPDEVAARVLEFLDSHK